ncbi:MAG: N-acetylornithine carbamoyltransferase [Planctomycetota bacterium]|nr:N-acetylornithine carbamoyltransferase [Planctomycetota bacterium]
MSEKPSIPHLIRLQDLAEQEVDDLLDLSGRIKRRTGGFQLTGKSVGLLFFRGSLRTRTSFEAAMHQLGGHSINLTASSDFWDLETTLGAKMDGKAPEHVKDAAAVLSRYVNVLAIRPALVGQSWANDRRDEGIQSWARHAKVPVINMESALWHPLQALADLLTLRETLGNVKSKKLAIVWTHSPVPASSAVTNSLLLAALRSGMDVRVAHPAGYELDDAVLFEAARTAETAGTKFESGLAARNAVEGAHVVYARSWQSIEDYGNPTLSASRRARAGGWMIDEALMKLGADARLMHAMPVRRNLEVTDEVLDGPRSLVYDQAENRLHTQKAVLVKLNRS